MNQGLNYFALATTLAGGVCTLAIFSFLIKENPFYRLFEHFFIGIAAGWGIILTVKNFIWPTIVVPVAGLDIITFPDGTSSASYNQWYLLYLFPAIFGLLYYFIYSKRYGWLAKLPIGLSLGWAGGLAFEGFFNQMLPQFQSSFKPLLVAKENAAGGRLIDWWTTFNNAFFVFTLLAVMYYFFFSFRRESTVAKHFAGTGRWLMMICFGAYFGSTVMARMALLVERLRFLLQDWVAALQQIL